MTNSKDPEIKQSTETNSYQDTTSPIIDLQLRRYSTILGYLQYENTAYWSRSQMFLVANAAFLGLLANNIPLTVSVTWSRLYTLIVPAIGGVFLSFLWWKSLKAAHIWIQRWEKLLLKLEPDAFGGLQVFDHSLQNKRPDSIKRKALWTVRLFIILWLLSIIYLLFISFIKFEKWEIL